MDNEPEIKRIDPPSEEQAQKILDAMMSETGFKKLLDADWHDMLLHGVQNTTIEQLVEKYGDLLTADELERIKAYIKPIKQ